MKVYLFKSKKIGIKTYPACAVVDVTQPEGAAIIAAGEGKEMPEGTMARIKSYDVPGCLPPPTFQAKAAEPEALEEKEEIEAPKIKKK